MPWLWHALLVDSDLNRTVTLCAVRAAVFRAAVFKLPQLELPVLGA